MSIFGLPGPEKTRRESSEGLEKMIRRLDPLSYNDRLTDFINVHKLGKCQEFGARFFSVVLSDTTRSSGHKLEHGKFHLNFRKTSCECERAL